MDFNFIKQVIPYAIRVLLAVPLSVILTYLLLPVWGWFEGATEIESLGFHGPVFWCYVVMFLVVAFCLIVRCKTGDADDGTG